MSALRPIEDIGPCLSRMDARNHTSENFIAIAKGLRRGAVVRAPVEGAAPEKFDEVKVMAVKGVVKAVKLLYGVGVVAETPWAAFAARRAVEGSVSWRSAEVWCGTQSQTMALEATANALGIDRRLDMLAQCSAGTLLNKSHPRNQLKPLIASDF